MKNQDIQALRAIAILMVLSQHVANRLPAAGWPQFRFGTFWGGVDLFFAISGFVIASSVLGNRSGPLDYRFDLEAFRQFWRRRGLRLMPASVFWAFASVALASFLATTAHSDPILVLRSALAGLLGVSNAFWTLCIGSGAIGDWCAHPDINGVYWSLALELQFYLLFSLGLLVIPVRGMAVIAVLVAVLWPSGASHWSFAWSFRPQALCLGFLACLWLREPRHAEWISRIPSHLRLLGMMAAIAVVYAAPAKIPGIALALMAVASTLCVVLASRDGAFGNASRVLSWIGDRSYSIYLSHLLVILCVREVLLRSGMPISVDGVTQAIVLVATIALAFLVGHLSYVFVEVPFTRRASAMAKRPIEA